MLAVRVLSYSCTAELRNQNPRPQQIHFLQAMAPLVKLGDPDLEPWKEF